MPGSDYDDILFLSRPESTKRKRMTNLERAAQFAPFAALTGYDAAIAETARLTEEQGEPGDWERADLNEKLNLLLAHIQERPEITITWFQPDGKKAGGAYVTKTGKLKKLKTVEREMLLTDGTVISLDAVSNLTGTIFEELENEL